MPRKTLDLGLKVETLSILSPDGKVDKDLEPKIPDKDLLRIYRGMLLARRLDEQCLAMQRQGRIGTYGPATGQEATPVGFAYWLSNEDWFVPSYREWAGYLYRGWPMYKYIVWWGGHEHGSEVPEGINDLPICVPIASQCQYAMGVAWGCKLRKNGKVCVTFCGDGGTSQGDFHEALNYATVFDVPLVTVVQNNHWAISVPREKQTASQTIAQKAIAYGMDALQIDGNDILAVLVAAKETIDRARNGGGPSLVEAITYRVMMHTTADDPRKYRSDEEVEPWKAKDPLIRFKTYLQNKGLFEEKVEKLIEEEVANEIREGVKQYEAYEHDPYEFFRHVYEEMTPELEAQLAELKAYRENGAAAPSKPAVIHA